LSPTLSDLPAVQDFGRRERSSKPGPEEEKVSSADQVNSHEAAQGTDNGSIADPWGGLFRAATTFTEASTGAEKSVGHGGSPRGCRLRLAPWIAPTPRMTSVPRGRLKALCPFPVAVSSETSPSVGYKVQSKTLKPARLKAWHAKEERPMRPFLDVTGGRALSLHGLSMGETPGPERSRGEQREGAKLPRR
jgi:hypothetical protein